MRIRDNSKADASVNASNILCYAIQECKEFDMPPLPLHSEKVEFSNKLKSNNSTSQLYAIYPNPTNNNLFLTIPINKQNSDIRVRVIDALGNKISDIGISKQNGNYSINSSNLANGIYYISIYTNGNLDWSSKFSIIK